MKIVYKKSSASRRFAWLTCVLLVSLSACATTPIDTDTDVVWQAWADKDISTLSDDNTGATFAESREVLTPKDEASLMVTPSGSSLETKVALTVSGADLAAWEAYDQLVLEVYLPPKNTLNPTDFFLGMADTTGGEFGWLDGLFSDSSVQTGWNRVVYTLSEPLREPQADRTYTLYLSFFASDADENKVPLTEPFYLGNAYLAESAPEPGPGAGRDPVYDAEAEALLELDDAALMAQVARETFDYFWREANPDNGLIKDRSTEDSPASIAAVGFGLSAFPVAIEEGWITRDEGYNRVLTTLQTFANGGVEGKNGFFYHFVDMENGRRAWSSELSSIDTALFIAGVVTVGEYFPNTEVSTLTQSLYEAVDWAWMLNGGDTLAMGWTPEGGFLEARWSAFNEDPILYILAIGSPTHPLPATSWDAIYRPVATPEDAPAYIYIPAEPLFIYQYPLAWLDLRNMEDDYANYVNNAALACERNAAFSAARQDEYETYQNGVWGLSASDGPDGYKAYGASDGNHDGTIAPYASVACWPFTPELTMQGVRGMLQTYGSLVWRDYGFVSAINAERDWYSTEHIGIDQGDIFLMIENVRNGLVWRLFTQNEDVQKALQAVGFVTKEADYAVTPAYLADWLAREGALKEPVSAPQATTDITVDGDLSDWTAATWYTVDKTMNVPNDGVAPVGADADLSSTFAVLWDADTLYLAADVTDDVVVSNLAPDDLENFYRTDSVEFYLDPSKAGSSAGLVKFAVIPFDTAGQVQAIRHEDANPGPIAVSAPGTLVASSRTSGGYIIEMAVPLNLLGVPGAAGTQLGFSHVVHNSNQADAEVGAYVRENIIGWNPAPDVWARPDTWSTLTLQ